MLVQLWKKLAQVQTENETLKAIWTKPWRKQSFERTIKNSKTTKDATKTDEGKEV